EFVVAHRGAASEGCVGLVVAEDGPDAIECSRSGGVDAGEVADAGKRAVGEGAQKGGCDVGSSRSGEGTERPVQPSGHLWSSALVAPDHDGVVEQIDRARVVPEA